MPTKVTISFSVDEGIIYFKSVPESATSPNFIRFYVNMYEDVREWCEFAYAVEHRRDQGISLDDASLEYFGEQQIYRLKIFGRNREPLLDYIVGSSDNSGREAFSKLCSTMRRVNGT